MVSPASTNCQKSKENKLSHQNKTPTSGNIMGLRSGRNTGGTSSPATKSFDARFDELTTLVNSHYTNLMARLDGIQTQVAGMGLELKAINERVTTNETILAALQSRIAELESEVAAIHENAVANDLILRGLPSEENEDLKQTFSTLCSSINCTLPEVNVIFRANYGRDDNSSADGPVIIKLKSSADKVRVLKSAAAFRKTLKGPLTLSHAGVDSEAPIYLNESLSKAQQQILNAAVRLKKKKKLFSVFTFRGRVRIKSTKEEDPIELRSLRMLNELFRDS